MPLKASKTGKDMKSAMENISLDQFKAMCGELRAAGKIPFELGYDLARSPYIEYHYGFIYEEDEFSRTVWRYFDKHYTKGIAFLLSQIARESEPEIRAKILMMLGRTLDQILTNPNIECEQDMVSAVVSLAARHARCGTDIEREKAAIVLGWIGRLPQAALLGSLMLEDNHEKVRAWAASSFMQMASRLPDANKEALKTMSLPYFAQALEQEKDIFAVGVMVGSLGDLCGKKFSLSWAAIEAKDRERIEKSRKSALRFIAKLASA